VNAYFLNDTNYNAWVLGDKKYIRLYASDISSTLNQSNLRYLSVPSSDRPCGVVDNVLGLSAFAIYSCNKLLNGSYDGPLFRVKRTSDNVEQDFYQVGGLTNWADVISFKGASTLKLIVVYDQTGNGNDLDQISGTTLLDTTEKGWFLTGTMWLDTGTISIPSVTKLTNIVRCKRTATSATQVNIPSNIISSGLNSSGGIKVDWRPSSEARTQLLINYISGTNDVHNDTDANAFKTYAISVEQNALIDFYVDGVFASQQSWNAGATIGNITKISTGATSSNSNRSDGYVSDIVVYQDKLTDEQVESITNYINSL
jgi:hypothetical protein